MAIVPSASNIADLPSQGSISEVWRQFTPQMKPILQVQSHEMSLNFFSKAEANEGIRTTMWKCKSNHKQPSADQCTSMLMSWNVSDVIFWDRMHSLVEEQKKSTFHGPFLGPSGGTKNETVKSQNPQQRPTLATNKKLQLHLFKQPAYRFGTEEVRTCEAWFQLTFRPQKWNLKAHMWYQLSPFPSSNVAICAAAPPRQHSPILRYSRYSATPCCVFIQLPNVIDTISKRWRSKKPFNTSPSHIFS